MSYSLSVSGHVGSSKGEADILSKAADFVEAAGADGAFSFVGSHLNLSVPPGGDAVAAARALVAEYNAQADADDQAGGPVEPDVAEEPSTPETPDQ